jgi:hypothetical protein
MTLTPEQRLQILLLAVDISGRQDVTITTIETASERVLRIARTLEEFVREGQYQTGIEPVDVLDQLPPRPISRTVYLRGRDAQGVLAKWSDERRGWIVSRDTRIHREQMETGTSVYYSDGDEA